MKPVDTTARLYDELWRELRRTWPLAQAHWSRFLLLRDPGEDSTQPSVAQIDLRSRQVTVNAELILKNELVDSLEAILAHEVGHHVRFPATMQTNARLRLLERTLVPDDDYSLINHFTDLLINEQLGDRLREPLMKVYRSFTVEPAFHGEGGWKRDPGFVFYLAIYEELWDLESGALMGPATAAFSEAFPAYRAEARVLACNVFALGPNLYAQFLYFLSIMLHYLTPPEEEELRANHPMHCGRGEPTADEWAEAVTPSSAELDAIRRAIEKGWFDADQADRLERAKSPENRIAGLPGFGTPDATAVPEIMAAYYRQQAENHLLRPPPQRRLGDLTVPTTLEEWELGEPTRDIDWTATFLLRGRELGGVLPLRRVKVAEEEGLEPSLWQPRIEIYLDVSGSMPNPCFAVNAMTLAAMILATGTVRAGGWVRALTYSSAPVLFWEWGRSETDVSRFLMHYVGGGTDFPFNILDESVRSCAGDQPIRVIITDSDFDSNVDHEPGNSGVLSRAAAASPRFVLLLRAPAASRVATYRGLGASVVAVDAMDDFPRMAAELTFALFPEPCDGRI
jgi:hypothetical protein